VSLPLLRPNLRRVAAFEAAQPCPWNPPPMSTLRFLTLLLNTQQSTRSTKCRTVYCVAYGPVTDCVQHQSRPVDRLRQRSPGLGAADQMQRQALSKPRPATAGCDTQSGIRREREAKERRGGGIADEPGPSVVDCRFGELCVHQDLWAEAWVRQRPDL
jgi:hypothetical protein